MAANHNQTVNIPASMGQILTVLRDRAFCSALNLELKSENPSQTGVWFRFHHGVTFTSWGEKITVTLTPVSAEVTSVNAHSECGMPTQIVDWGKNKQNVCNVLEYIEKMAPTAVASASAAPAAAEAAPAAAEAAPAAQAANKKFCIHCGKQIDADALFCTYCGKKQS